MNYKIILALLAAATGSIFYSNPTKNKTTVKVSILQKEIEATWYPKENNNGNQTITIQQIFGCGRAVNGFCKLKNMRLIYSQYEHYFFVLSAKVTSK